MKHIPSFIILISIVILTVSMGNAHNPFTTKPKEQHVAPQPPIKSEFFVKIIHWQHQLRQKMSDLVREAKETGSPGPLLFLFGVAFVYGMVHSAGPGHGKAFALAYIFTQRPRWSHGVLFANLIALFHGTCGILLVLVIRIMLQKSITGAMADVSRITQLISYGLITCLGAGLFVHGIYKWIKNKKQRPFLDNQKKRLSNPVLSSLVVGIIPCPVVVMVMLFALSMDMITLGIILGLIISLGMALTITLVVLLALSGNVISLTVASRKKNFSEIIEHLIALIAAMAITALGSVLFLATV
jgi:ABC-type nickel/cobalt efflux system permease component RcnA